ncbi:hypothetical protein ARMSODRAFT_1036565 [Armillaria solidipes]|uniref:Reverse transcriptase zinc-binding domain-containing protein n=1 Tax=Armillaria solidipes TaxID=1076256 RepID=A0A2H3AHC7_9AGAR|nr:hypothetical protein ARMSODRAFT_1036565 [Armillaria solidipes]
MRISSGPFDLYTAEVEKVAETWLLQQLNSTAKLYLIHHRLEVVGKQRKKTLEVPLKMRIYLTCPVSKYRDALASVVFSTHKLAIERLRWADHGRRSIARDQRLCRLCTTAVETPEHVILECDGSGFISQLRLECMEKIHTAIPEARVLSQQRNLVQYLQWLLEQEKIVLLVGKFVY